MCELNRFVDLRDANGNGELLRGINRKLSHHGPDAEGYYEQGPARAGTTSKSCYSSRALRNWANSTRRVGATQVTSLDLRMYMIVIYEL